VVNGLAHLADGPYVLGLRPHHVRPVASAASDAVAVKGRVSIAEISGSESVVHFDLNGNTWVSLSHGVRGFGVGAAAAFSLDVAHGMYFSAEGRCLSSAED
jgi:glycerol transport system ATP-binding protein